MPKHLYHSIFLHVNDEVLMLCCDITFLSSVMKYYYKKIFFNLWIFPKNLSKRL